MADVELKPCQCGSAVELCRGDDDCYIYCPKCKLKTFSDRVYDNIRDNCGRLIKVRNGRADDGKINTKEAVLPAPCKQVNGVDVKAWTIKQWFAKINEEMDELKEAMLRWSYLDSVGLDVEISDETVLADEAADTITAITSMLEAVGVDERQRQEAQIRVNDKNRGRGRL